MPKHLAPSANEPPLAFRQLDQLDLDLDLATRRCGRAAREEEAVRGAGEAGGRRDHLSIGGPEELAPLVRSLAEHEANTGSAEVQIVGPRFE